METESIKTYYERYSAQWLPNSKIKADEDTRELYYKILKAITKENKEDLIRF
jgi:hypothetical protein